MNFSSGNGVIKGTISGVSASTGTQKLWLVSQGIGDIAFAYPYSMIVLNIQVQGELHNCRILVCYKALHAFILILEKCEGHFDITTTRERDDEEGIRDFNRHHNIFLSQRWSPRICFLWRSNTGKPLDWFRIL